MLERESRQLWGVNLILSCVFIKKHKGELIIKSFDSKDLGAHCALQLVNPLSGSTGSGWIRQHNLGASNFVHVK